MKGRYIRLLIGTLMPAVVGVLLFFILLLTKESPKATDASYITAIQVFFFMLLFGYIFVGIQSLLYSVAMEFYINPKVNDQASAIAISTAIGALCGLILGPPGMLIGGASGLITGLCVRKLYDKAARS